MVRITTPLSDIWAHCNEPLVDHLRNVAKLAEKFAASDIQSMACLAGITHDIAKATSFFQKYLRANGKKRADACTHHAYASAVFGAWVANSYNIDPLPVFLAIARHHGNLKTPSEITISDFERARDPLRSELKALKYQVEDLLKNGQLVNLCNELELPDPTPFLKGEVWTTIDNLHNLGKKINRSSNDRNAYWTVNRVFSCLIDADKKASGGVIVPDRLIIPNDIVDRYVSSLPCQSTLDKMRNQLYHQVNERVIETPLEELQSKQITLTAPTGSGKTLTVFNAAIKLRNRIAENGSEIPRIIYALPFINLIEQNHDVFHRVLQNHPPYMENPNRFLIQHHHLTPLDDYENHELESVEERLMLTEAWDAEIVVTTFAELLHSLVTNRNRSLKKFHNIENSIIILDEPQSIQARQWLLVRSVLDDIRDFNATIMLMTATQPAILENTLEIAPPLESWDSRCEVERWTTHSIDGLVQEIVAKGEASRLVVVNTIRDSIELYNKLKKNLATPVYYLSTNITPFERKKRLEKVKGLLMSDKPEPVTLVSTQVVEAGIDLDFEEGYREIGPLDSVIQVAGRINRNHKRKNGHLYLFKLEESHADLIYGKVLLEISEKIFEKYIQGTLNDKELDGLTSNYFQEVANRKVKDKKILEAMKRLRYDDSQERPVSSYRFIEELPTVRIIVELNDDASRKLHELSRKLHELRNALTIEDIHERRTRVKILRQKLELFTISTSLPRLKSNRPPPLFYDDPTIVRDDIFIIPKEEIEQYYSTKNGGMEGTGFKWLPSETIDSQFI